LTDWPDFEDQLQASPNVHFSMTCQASNKAKAKSSGTTQAYDSMFGRG